MRLNLPVDSDLADCRTVLLAGIGGGFDIFCALPLYFELRAAGRSVHLASLSFSDLSEYRRQPGVADGLFRVQADYSDPVIYFPELHLARWFRERRGEDVAIWCFERTGAKPLHAAYRALLDHLAIDAIVMVDGGVDSLARGDEAQLGTVVEDSLSLAAVYQLDHVPVRLLAAVGLGTEPDVCHAHIFQNIAGLASGDAFLGSCSLVRRMEPYELYEDAVRYAHEQPFQDPSVVNASIVSAVQGHFGDFHLTEKTHGSRLWISPLMPIYWFFDLRAVAESNTFVPALRTTESFSEVRQVVWSGMSSKGTRQPAGIPLP
jgi:hypothetical protein